MNLWILVHWCHLNVFFLSCCLTADTMSFLDFCMNSLGVDSSMFFSCQYQVCNYVLFCSFMLSQWFHSSLKIHRWITNLKWVRGGVQTKAERLRTKEEGFGFGVSGKRYLCVVTEAAPLRAEHGNPVIVSGIARGLWLCILTFCFGTLPASHLPFWVPVVKMMPGFPAEKAAFYALLPQMIQLISHKPALEDNGKPWIVFYVM